MLGPHKDKNVRMWSDGSVGVLMKFVWRSLGVEMDVLGVWVGGWVSEFRPSRMVYMLILTTACLKI